MSKNLKVTIIGGGNMGINHARVFNNLGCLDKIVEKDCARRDFLRKIYGNHTIISDLKNLCSDAYVIATPTSSHFSIAKELMLNGKHILIEKPVCKTVEEAEALRKIAKNSNVKIAVGHVERFNPVVNYLKSWLDDKTLKIIETYRLSALPAQVKDVGVFQDLGIHDVDVVLSLINSKIKSIHAMSSEKDGRDVYTKAGIQFENGACAFITTSWLSTSKTRKIYVSTKYEDAEMDYLKQSFETKRININLGENHFQPLSFHNIEKIELKRKEPLLLQAKDFIAAIEDNDHKLKVDLNQGYEALKVVESILIAAKENRVIQF
tara:strand:+ start:311 stop:1273 length:963 start_codon:yes stop_codon:yes gene_type:complete